MMVFDEAYGAGAWTRLVQALAVPGHPLPAVTLDAVQQPWRVKVDWGNGAHATLRFDGGPAVHFQELCSAVGREHATGLYTTLVAQLVPVAQSLGIYAVTCEPATDFAKDKLMRRGRWMPVGGWWVWWILTPEDRQTLDYVVRQARELVRKVQAERG